jgi:Transport protein particle (TRAPP) component
LHRLADFGKHVGIRVLDLFFLRVGKDKREVRLTPMLVFIQKVFWKVSFSPSSVAVRSLADLLVFIQS